MLSAQPLLHYMPNNRLFQPSEILVGSPSSEIATLLSRDGRVVGVSLDGADSGGVMETRWTHDNLFFKLYFQAENDDLVVLHGIDQVAEDGSVKERASVKVLDRRTGAVICEFTPLQMDDVAWIDLTPVGTILLEGGLSLRRSELDEIG